MMRTAELSLFRVWLISVILSASTLASANADDGNNNKTPDESELASCPATRHVRHCLSGRILYLTTISYAGKDCRKTQKVVKTSVDRTCPIGTQYSKTECSREGWRVETSLTTYLDDCVCKRRRLNTKKRCLPECQKPKISVQCIDNSLYRVETGEKVVDFACTGYTKQEALKPNCVVGVRRKRGICRGFFMSITELQTTYKNCRCKTTSRKLKQQCACPKTKVRTKCDGNVKMRIITTYRLGANKCKTKIRVQRIPISCPKVRVKSRTGCRPDCTRTMTLAWSEVRNCRCVRPMRKRTAKCCCPKPTRSSYCRSNILHTMVRSFQLRQGQCKEKVKITKKPIACNTKLSPVKSSCAFNGYRRVILHSQERRGCVCVKRRQITYEKCGCGKDYTTEECNDNVWTVRTVTHKLEPAKSNTCARQVAEKKTPTRCRGKLQRRVSKCQPDGYQVVRQLVEEAQDCVCVTRVISQRERCRCEKSRTVQECRNNRIYRHQHVQHLVDGKCIKRRTTSVVRIQCGANSVKQSDCVKGWRTKTYVAYHPTNCKCAMRVYNRQIRCACPKNHTKTRCIQGKIVRSEVKFELRDGQCIGRSCKTTRRVHCPRQTVVKRGKCVRNRRHVTIRETRRRGCACKTRVTRSRETCGCPRPKVKRLCSKTQVLTVRSIRYRLVEGACHVKEEERVIPSRCPSEPVHHRGRCRPDGSRIDTWVHHRQSNCVCHRTVKRARRRCSCPKPSYKKRCVKHVTREQINVSYRLVHGVCKESVSAEGTPIFCPEVETPIYGRCRGGRRLITYVRYRTRNCRCIKRTRVKKIPCNCALLNYQVKQCEANKKRFVVREHRFTDAASECKDTVKVVYQPINCPEEKQIKRSACDKDGFQTVTMTYNLLVNCACVRGSQKRLVACSCPKPKVELKPDHKLKWNRRCTTTYTLNRAENRCDKKADCPAESKEQKLCKPVMAPPKIEACNPLTGSQRVTLTLGRVVLLPQPLSQYSCLVKKVTTSRRCACPKPTKRVKCLRNVLTTVTVTQTLKDQKCTKTKKIDKKVTECPKPTATEGKCESDNTKVVTQVTFERRQCKCIRRVKHKRLLCRCPDPIVSTRCLRHSTKVREILSYKLKGERCHRRKQISKTKIKCRSGTKVKKTKCSVKCNQRVTKVTRYIRDCECRTKIDIASVKCCCRKASTRLTCRNHSRREVITTSFHLVRGACQKRRSRREKKIVCLSNHKPVRGPCKPSGYRKVTFVSQVLRNCKCVKVQRQTSELCRCPRSHQESSCKAEKLITRITQYRLTAKKKHGGGGGSSGKKRRRRRHKNSCTKHVRTFAKDPGCPVGTHVVASKCHEDDFKRIATTTRYQENCKCKTKVKTEKVRCRCPKTTKKISCRGHNVAHVTVTRYSLHGSECLKDVQTMETKVDCYETEKPDRSPCGDDGYRQVKLVSYQPRDCRCARKVEMRRERCSCPKDYRARECINNQIVSTYVTYSLTSKECVRRSRITKEKPKCKLISKETKGVCRSDGFQSIFYENEKLENCECRKKVLTKQIRCACPKSTVKRSCQDNKLLTTRTSYKLSGGQCHRSKNHHKTKIDCPAKKRVIRHKCTGNKRIYEYIHHRVERCACKAVHRRVTKPCRCPRPTTEEKSCVDGKQKVVTIYYIKDRLGNCKPMTDIDTQVCAERKDCRCDALGDPHFLTYDGTPLHFQGECKYTLTKLRNSGDRCAFEVEVKNEHRGENLNYTYVRLMDIRVFGHVFRLHQHKRFLVDGKIAALPYSRHGVRAFYSGLYVQFVAPGCRFKAAFDGHYTGYVEVGREYAGRMVGLCGNCNGKQADDYLTRDGVNVIEKRRNFERDNLVGNSFRVPDDSDSPGDKCKDAPVVNPLSACSNAWIPKARALCHRIIDARGPFARCLAGGRVPALALFNDCTSDACVNRARPPMLRRAVCEAHKDMAEQCAETGHAGIQWRSKDFCPIKCDKDKEYTTNMRPCPRTCENLFFGTKVNCYHLPNREGCACRRGMVLDGRKCVQPEMCQCVKKFPDLMCKDDAQRDQCLRWRAAGHCASNPYSMLQMCRKTCELCHAEKPKAACRNVMSLRRCLLLERKRQCGTSFVSTACQRTCGLCRSDSPRKSAAPATAPVTVAAIRQPQNATGQH